jgi:hypothetical protein
VVSDLGVTGHIGIEMARTEQKMEWTRAFGNSPQLLVEVMLMQGNVDVEDRGADPGLIVEILGVVGAPGRD